MQKKKIRFVYFDIGGVLFNFKPAIFYLAEYYDTSFDDVARILKKYDDAVCRGKMSAAKLGELFNRELKTKNEIQNFLDVYTDHFTQILPMHDLIQEVIK